MRDLEGSIDRIASETGVLGRRARRPGRGPSVAKAYGSRIEGSGSRTKVDTRFGIASGTKGFTALTVMSLIEEGRLWIWARPPARCSATTCH